MKGAVVPPKPCYESNFESLFNFFLSLLAHGARPDWQNPERGFNCSLHVAAASNQPLQIELLAVYGANPSVLNEERKSAEEVALDKGHYALANRITEIRFEVLGKPEFNFSMLFY